MKRVVLLATTLLCACGAAQRTPMVQVPLFTRAGEFEAGIALSPASPRAELGGQVRLAASDLLRVGGSVGGATRRAASDSLIGASGASSHPAFYADGFVGAEWGGLLFRVGGLVGVGYGKSQFVSQRCSAGDALSRCVRRERIVFETRYLRSYGQLHVALAPPGPLATSLALRVPFVTDLSSTGRAPEADVSPELALTQSLRFRRLRFDAQPMWSRAQGFAFHLALLLRFRPW